MSLLQFDGFDSEGVNYIRYGTYIPQGQWSGPQTEIIRDTGTYRPGGSIASYRLYKNYWAGECYIYKTFDVTTNILIVGLGFRMSAFNSDQYPILLVRDRNNTGNASFSVNTSGKLVLSGTDLAATGNTTLAINTQYYLQVKYRADRKNGYVIAILNNNIEFELYNRASSPYNQLLDQVIFRCGGSANNTYCYLWIDDIYICNDDGIYPNDFLGTTITKSQFPVSNGDVMDYTPYGATYPYDCIDEQSQNSGDFVYSSVVNQKALFNFTDITTSSKIFGVFLQDMATRTDWGQGISKYKLVVRDVNDNEWLSGELVSNENASHSHNYLFTKHPVTDATQTSQLINDLQIGQITTQID